MNDVPTWIQIVQALATPAVAIAAGAIAYRQWRTAHEKVVLDLFEKRFEVFMGVREIVSRGGKRTLLRDQGLPNELLARGRFLFGRDVVSELEEIHRLCAEVDTGSHTAFRELHETFDRILVKLEPYMEMSQKRVSWGDWLTERNKTRLSYADEKQK
ncbi:hypothetical protein [Neorhizobium sp. T25_13]|uniref:hypothetical protein n=1 Tax=Neorhizobium sp. T25_13 TaxID=2093830 RepID=UPI000CF99E96|nr:hypothetical protein [Neorhizobium sp. T25_13]